MGDSVIVPLYPEPGATTSIFRVAVGDALKADCTRVQSLAHEFIGEPSDTCTGEPWQRVRIGVRKFLDIDRRIAKAPAPSPLNPRDDWWPRQNDIHFASNPAISSYDKLYGVVSDNDWNSQAAVMNVAAVRLTSKSKQNRLRWEVSVSGGFVVAGDVYSVALSDFEQKPPAKAYPSQLTDDESCEIAEKQKVTLTLKSA